MAKYFDGKSAQSQMVDLAVEAAHLRGMLTAETLFEWPLARVYIATEPERDRDAVLSNKDNRDARLHVSKAEYLLIEPLIKGRGANWFSVSWYSILAMAILAIIVVIGLAFITPKLVRPLAAFVPYNWEVALGEQVFDIVAGDDDICRNTDGEAALREMLAALQAGSSIENPNVRITVLDSWEVNAFAMPGDRMVFYRGLIDQAESPDEVAAVMAHELGHIEANHPLEGLVVHLGLSSLIAMMFGGSANLEVVASTGQIFLILNNGREAEREADSLAVQYMTASNIDPTALSSFFQKMQSDEASVFDLDLSYFSTHPPLAERIASIDGDSQSTDTYQQIISDEAWAHIQAMCD